MVKLKSRPNIFIVCDNSERKCLKSQIRQLYIQEYLEGIGYTVINPIKKKNINTVTKQRFFLHDLKKIMKSKAIYIMPNVSLKKGENIELKIAIELNLTVLHGFVIKYFETE